MENKGPISRWVFRSNNFLHLEGAEKEAGLFISLFFWELDPLGIRVRVTLRFTFQSL